MCDESPQRKSEQDSEAIPLDGGKSESNEDCLTPKGWREREPTVERGLTCERVVIYQRNRNTGSMFPTISSIHRDHQGLKKKMYPHHSNRAVLSMHPSLLTSETCWSFADGLTLVRVETPASFLAWADEELLDHRCRPVASLHLAKVPATRESQSEPLPLNGPNFQRDRCTCFALPPRKICVVSVSSVNASYDRLHVRNSLARNPSIAVALFG